jgi:hypothetical protein
MPSRCIELEQARGARTQAATAAVEFETTLAASRDASTLEFAAEATAAEQQLATIWPQSEQTRVGTEQSQQGAASRSEQQLEQAMSQAHMLVAEAKSRAERIRGDSERELAAVTQRDSINAQLSNVRQMLAALGGVAAGNPMERAAPAAGQSEPATAGPPPADRQRALTDDKGDKVKTAKLKDDKGKGRLEPGARRQGLSVRTRTRLADPCGISKPQCHFCCASDDRC